MFKSHSILSLRLRLSEMSRAARRTSRRLRQKQGRHLQETSLPCVGWQSHFDKISPIDLVQGDRANGNVRPAELYILGLFASQCRTGTDIFEIGTFDGRTALNMAINCGADSCVYTLDLLPHMETVFALDAGERHLVDKPLSGAWLLDEAALRAELSGKVIRLFGDSASFDFSSYHGSCDLVFVDGSHSYEYVISDSMVAQALVRPGGIIVWHDYGIWPGVTRALEELHDSGELALSYIRGTSLAVFRSPESNSTNSLTRNQVDTCQES